MHINEFQVQHQALSIHFCTEKRMHTVLKKHIMIIFNPSLEDIQALYISLMRDHLTFEEKCFKI